MGQAAGLEKHSARRDTADTREGFVSAPCGLQCCFYSMPPVQASQTMITSHKSTESGMSTRNFVFRVL